MSNIEHPEIHNRVMLIAKLESFTDCSGQFREVPDIHKLGGLNLVRAQAAFLNAKLSRFSSP